VQLGAAVQLTALIVAPTLLTVWNVRSTFPDDSADDKEVVRTADTSVVVDNFTTTSVDAEAAAR
jgi:hypothetical protein